MKSKVLKLTILVFLFNSQAFGASVASSVLKKMDSINRAELKEGVPKKSLTRFYMHKKRGKFQKTRAVVVIFHGLLNSPTYTKWMADKIHSFGLNVINVNLVKHNHNKQSEREKRLHLMDLDTITVKDFQKQVKVISNLAEHMGDKMIFVGHSAGALSAVDAMMRKSKKTVGLVLYSPSFKLSEKTMLSSFLVGGFTPLARKLVNSSGDSRYLSTKSGRTTHYYANTFRQKGANGEHLSPAAQFKPMVKVMKRLPNKIFWIDTMDDATISENFNIKLVKGMSNVEHHIIPKSAGVAHVAAASRASDMKTKSGRSYIRKITKEMFAYIKEVSN